MATFQSQINILAAGQHKLHKKIEDLTDFKLCATYGESATIISDSVGTDNITIDGLGFKAYDCILTLDGIGTSTEIHFMGYDGLCEDFNTSATIGIVSSVKTTNGTSVNATLDGNKLTLTSPKLKVKEYTVPKVIDLTSLLEGGSTIITEGIKE